MTHQQNYKTASEVAHMIGCSRQSVSWDIKKNKVPSDPLSGLDVNHPLVIEYIRRKKLSVDTARTRATTGNTQQVVKEEREKYGTDMAQSVSDSGTLQDWTPEQKAYEETRLKKAQADAAILKYAEQLGAVIDIDSLNRIMSKFMDFLLTELIYLPGNVSDVCWLRAKTSEVPEKAIEEVLTDKIKAIVERGKALTSELVPSPNGLNYVILDPRDGEE